MTHAARNVDEDEAAIEEEAAYWESVYRGDTPAPARPASGPKNLDDEEWTARLARVGMEPGEPAPDETPDEGPPFDPAAGGAGREVRLTWAVGIVPRPVTWAWRDVHGRIPTGALVTAAGREGTGKSSFGVWLAARVSRGELPGSWHGTPRAVLYAAAEDSWAHTIVPRLMAARADLGLVARVDVFTTASADAEMLSLPEDLAALEKTITAHQVAVVILDPLLSLIDGRLDTHRNREVRTALDPLNQLADRTGAVVLGICHFNKSAGTDAAALITGSGAFKDVPRAVFGFARDDDGRVMTQVKNSLGRDDLASLAYQITTETVTIDGEPSEVGAFAMLGESDRSVRDVLRDARGGGDEVAERDEAGEWLLGYLRANGGEVKAKDVFRAARDDGIAERTVQRARPRVGVTTDRLGFGQGTIWSLPSTGGGERDDPFAPHSRHSRQAFDGGANGAIGGADATGADGDQPRSGHSGQASDGGPIGPNGGPNGESGGP